MSVCFRHASSANYVGKNVIVRVWRIQKGDLTKKKECAMICTLLSFSYAFWVGEDKNKLELPSQDKASVGCHLSLAFYQL